MRDVIPRNRTHIEKFVETASSTHQTIQGHVIGPNYIVVSGFAAAVIALGMVAAASLGIWGGGSDNQANATPVALAQPLIPPAGRFVGHCLEGQSAGRRVPVVLTAQTLTLNAYRYDLRENLPGHYFVVASNAAVKGTLRYDTPSNAWIIERTTSLWPCARFRLDQA